MSLPSHLSSSSSHPSLLPFSLSSLSCLLPFLVLFLLPTSISSSSCGAFDVDLTPLSTVTPPTPAEYDLDLRFANGVDWYGLHPCGIVDEVFCGSGSTGAMMCRYTVPLAYWREGEVTWAPYNGTGGVGLTMSAQNGATCQATGQPWGVTVNFLCDSGVIEGEMDSVTEDSPCHYTATVKTRYACEAGEEVGAGDEGGLGTAGMIGIGVGVTVLAVGLVIALVWVGLRWRGAQTWPREKALLEDGNGMEIVKIGVEMLSIAHRGDTRGEKV